MGASVQGEGLCLEGSLSKGVSVQGGLCPHELSVHGVGGLCQGDLPYGKERTVGILLECIFV